jgi:hypothetical protein
VSAGLITLFNPSEISNYKVNSIDIAHLKFMYGVEDLTENKVILQLVM